MSGKWQVAGDKSALSDLLLATCHIHNIPFSKNQFNWISFANTSVSLLKMILSSRASVADAGCSEVSCQFTVTVSRICRLLSPTKWSIGFWMFWLRISLCFGCRELQERWYNCRHSLGCFVVCVRENAGKHQELGLFIQYVTIKQSIVGWLYAWASAIERTQHKT